MKNTILLLSALAATSIWSRAAETGIETKPAKPFISDTFQEILQRVSERDATTGAIISIQSRNDAPIQTKWLRLTIATDERQGRSIISLTFPSKASNGLMEQYQLKTDGAMRLEAQNQLRFKELQAERDQKDAKKWSEEAKARIQKLTGGQFAFGDSMKKVEALKGKPISIKGPFMPQSATVNQTGTYHWVYANVTLVFGGDTLQDADENGNLD